MMISRSLLAITFGAILFVGCDSNDNNDDGPPNRVTITEVVINEFPDRNEGERWDGGVIPSNADVYFLLRNADNDNVLIDTDGDNFQDVEIGDAPLAWDTDYRTTDFRRPLYIELYDEDPTNEDDFMGDTEDFNLGEAADDNFRRTMTVTGDGISILLRLEWDRR